MEEFSLSKCYEGRVYDFTIKAEQKPLPRSCEKYGDLGYQGWQKLASNVILPIKKRKNQLLTKAEKLYNKSLASFRVKVEHKFRELKIFRILSGTYRNFRLKTSHEAQHHCGNCESETCVLGNKIKPFRLILEKL